MVCRWFAVSVAHATQLRTRTASHRNLEHLASSVQLRVALCLHSRPVTPHTLFAQAWSLASSWLGLRGLTLCSCRLEGQCEYCPGSCQPTRSTRLISRPPRLEHEVDISGLSLVCEQHAAFAQALAEARSNFSTMWEPGALQSLRGLSTIPDASVPRCVLAGPSGTEVQRAQLVVNTTIWPSPPTVLQGIEFSGFEAFGDIVDTANGSDGSEWTRLSGAVLSVYGPSNVTIADCSFVRNSVRRAQDHVGVQVGIATPDLTSNYPAESGGRTVQYSYYDSQAAAISADNTDGFAAFQLDAEVRLPLAFMNRSLVDPDGCDNCLLDPPGACDGCNETCSVLNTGEEFRSMKESVKWYSGPHECVGAAGHPPRTWDPRLDQSRPFQLGGSSTVVCDWYEQVLSNASMVMEDLWKRPPPACAKHVRWRVGQRAFQATISLRNVLFFGQKGQSPAVMASGVTLDVNGAAFVQNSANSYLTLQGYSAAGIAARDGTEATLRDVAFLGNSATWGSALDCKAATLNITNMFCARNTAERGAACLVAGSLTTTRTPKAKHQREQQPAISRPCRASFHGAIMSRNTMDRGPGPVAAMSGSQLSMQDVVLSDNTAALAGGVFLQGSVQAVMRNCTMENNFIGEPRSDTCMVSLADNCTLLVEDSAWVGNQHNGGCGGVGIGSETLNIDATAGPALPSSLIVRRSLFMGNRAKTLDGGAVVVMAGQATFEDCRFINNTANTGGGAVFVGTPRDKETEDYDPINKGLYYMPSAGTGDPLAAVTAQWTGSELVISTPIASRTGQVRFFNCSFEGNVAVAGSGGALACNHRSYTVACDRCSFVNNLAMTADAGAVSISQLCNGTFDSSVFRHNIVRSGNGAGLQVTREATAHLHGVALDGNVGASTAGGAGLAITSKASVFLSDSSLRRHRGSQLGGAMLLRSGARASLSNCSFVENEATRGLGGLGGAVLMQDRSTLFGTNVTFHANVAAEGGALAVHDHSNCTLLSVSFNETLSDQAGACFSIRAGSSLFSSNISSESGESTADEGGFLFLQDSQATLEGVRLSGHKALQGAGFSISGSAAALFLRDLDSVANSVPGSGAFMLAGGGARVEFHGQSTVRDSFSRDGQGGAIFIQGATMEVVGGLDISAAETRSAGGGCIALAPSTCTEPSELVVSGRMALKHCTAAGDGGGLLLDAVKGVRQRGFVAATVSGVLHVSESSSNGLQGGGGVLVASGAKLSTTAGAGITILNCTAFRGNGGGLCLADEADITAVGSASAALCTGLDGSAGLVLSNRSHMTVADNEASAGLGGGLFAGHNASFVSEGSLGVRSNTAVGVGGAGIAAVQCNLSLLGPAEIALNVLRSSSIDSHGGGILCSGCELDLRHARLVGNSVFKEASRDALCGGGMSIAGGAVAALHNVTSAWNWCAEGDGTGLAVSHSFLSVDAGTVLRENEAAGAGSGGAGLLAEDSARVVVRGLLVEGNFAQARGGGILARSLADIQVPGELAVRGNFLGLSPPRFGAGVALESGATMTLAAGSQTSIHEHHIARGHKQVVACPLNGSSFGTFEGGAGLALTGAGTRLQVMQHANMTVAKNTHIASWGGGALVHDGACLRNHGSLSVHSNVAAVGAGIAVNQGSSVESGGGLQSQNNTASSCAGGLLSAGSSSLRLNGSSFKGNQVVGASRQSWGGGVALVDPHPDTRLQQVLVRDNSSPCRAAGILCVPGSGQPSSRLALLDPSANNNTGFLGTSDLSCPPNDVNAACMLVDGFGRMSEAQCAVAHTIHVSASHPTRAQGCCGSQIAPCASLEDALSQAQANDTILLDAGLHAIGPSALEIPSTLQGLTISGHAGGTTLLSCGGERAAPALHISTSGSLRFLSFVNCTDRIQGTTARAPIVLVDGTSESPPTLVLEDVVFKGAGRPGARALHADQADLRMTRVRFLDLVFNCSDVSTSVGSSSEDSRVGAAVLFLDSSCSLCLEVEIKNSSFSADGAGAMAVVGVDASLPVFDSVLEDCSFLSLNASRGAGIFVAGASAARPTSLLCQRCTFQDLAVSHKGPRRFGDGGGAVFIAPFAHLHLVSTTVKNCTATYDHSESSLSVPALGGAVLVSDDASLLVRNSTFKSGFANQGGLIHASSHSTVHIAESVLSHSRAASGGCVLCSGCSLHLEASLLHHCEATGGDGGAVLLQQPLPTSVLIVHDSEVSHSRASQAGGGVHLREGNLRVEHSRVHSCQAVLGGGMSAQRPSNVTFRRSVVSDCTATVSGGGLFVEADVDDRGRPVGFVSLRATELLRNSVTAVDGKGGAAFVRHTGVPSTGLYESSFMHSSVEVRLSDSCLVEGNTAAYGGGLAVEGLGAALVLEGTDPTESLTAPPLAGVVRHNSAVFRGGGIWAAAASNVTALGVVVQRNSASRGGGLAAYDAIVHLRSCTVKNNWLIPNPSRPCTAETLHELAGGGIEVGFSPSGSHALISIMLAGSIRSRIAPRWPDAPLVALGSPVDIAACLFHGNDAAGISVVHDLQDCAGVSAWQCASGSPGGELVIAATESCAVASQALRHGHGGAALQATAEAAQQDGRISDHALLRRFLARVQGNVFAVEGNSTSHGASWKGAVWWVHAEPVGIACNTFCTDCEVEGQSKHSTAGGLPGTAGQPCPFFGEAFSGALDDSDGCYLQANGQLGGGSYIQSVHEAVGTAPVSAAVFARQDAGNALQAFVPIDEVFIVALDAYGWPARVPGGGSVACPVFPAVTLEQAAANASALMGDRFVLTQVPASSMTAARALSAWQSAPNITAGADMLPSPPGEFQGVGGGNVWLASLQRQVPAQGRSNEVLRLRPIQSEAGDLPASPGSQHSFVVQECNPGYEVFADGSCVICPPGRVSRIGRECVDCPPGFVSPAEGGSACVPCRAPQIADSAGLAACETCADGFYVIQNASSSCSRCPVDSQQQGATCASGTVRLQPGYYFILDHAPGSLVVNGTASQLVADVRSSELPAGTQVVPCINPAACQTSDGLQVQCAPGHTGVMCGDCEQGYLNTGASLCLQCLDAALNYTVLILVICLVVGGVIYFSMSQSFSERDDASIVLRMLLNHLQMMGLLSLLRAQGTALFRRIFNFSNSLSGGGFLSPTSSVRCIWNSDFYVEFAMNMATTPFLLLVVFGTGLAVVLWGVMSEVADRPKLLKSAKGASTGRRQSSAVLNASKLKRPSASVLSRPGVGKAPEDPESAPSRPGMLCRAASAMRSGTARCCFVCSRTPCSRAMASRMWKAVKEYSAGGEYFSTMAFIASLSFSLVTSTVLKTFRCTAFEAHGHRWLLADLSVPCFTPDHVIAMVLAVIVGAAFSIGFPVTVIFILHRNKSALAFDPAFKKRYAFLIAGYRTEHAETEGVTMLRRVALALVSVLGDPLHEINVASLVLLASLSIHVATQPYKRPIFNLLESVSLWTMELTLFLSMAFLEVSRTSRSGTVDLQGDNFKDIELTITILLCLINFAALGLMLMVLVRFGSHAVRQQMESLTQKMPWMKGMLSALGATDTGLDEDKSASAAKKRRSVRPASKASGRKLLAVLELSKSPGGERTSAKPAPSTRASPLVSATPPSADRRAPVPTRAAVLDKGRKQGSPARPPSSERKQGAALLMKNPLLSRSASPTQGAGSASPGSGGSRKARMARALSAAKPGSAASAPDAPKRREPAAPPKQQQAAR